MTALQVAIVSNIFVSLENIVMLKKVFIMFCVGAVSLSALALSNEYQSKSKMITMIAVPRDPVLVQIMRDIAERYPVMQVCYQQVDGDLQIHAWDGDKWIDVPENIYENGNFFTNAPLHGIIVQAENVQMPKLASWCLSGNRITTTEPRAVIHLLGRFYNFPYRVWKDFAKRYRFEYEQINPAYLRTPWYHHYAVDIMRKRALRKTEKTDLGEWRYLNRSENIPIEYNQELDDPLVDPFSADETIPAAEVVLPE